MQTVILYLVLCASTSTELSREVTVESLKGYSPQGGVSISQTWGGGNGDFYYEYCQAMTKKARVKKPYDAEEEKN